MTRQQLGRAALWALGLTLFAAADFVRIEGLDHPAVQWVLQAVRG
jgi:hypothetical protein